MRDFGKSFIIYGIASSISKSVSLILVPLYTKIFSPELFGKVDLLNSLIVLLALISSLQLESSVSRYYFEIKYNKIKFINTAFNALLISSFLFFLILAPSSSLLNTYIFQDTLSNSSIILGFLVVPFLNIFTFFTVLMRFKKEPIKFLIFTFLQLIVTIGATYSLIYIFDLGVSGVFLGQIMGFLIPVVFIAAISMRGYKAEIDSNILRKFLKFSIPLIPSVSANWANTYANRIVLVSFLTFYELGLFAVAVKVGSIINLLQSAFSMTWQPFFWENYKTEIGVKNIRIIFLIVLWLLVLIIIIVSLFSQEILVFLTNDEYLEAAKYVGALSFALGMPILIQFFGQGPAIIGKTYINSVLFIVSLLFGLVLLLVFTYYLGMLGTTISMVLSALFQVMLTWNISERLFPLKYSINSFLLAVTVLLLIISINFFIELPLLTRILFASLASIFLSYYAIYIYKKFKASFAHL